MTPRENRQTNASHYAAAIARWDDEGGAPTSFATKTDGEVSNNERSGRMVEVLASLKVDQALAEEGKILECLGAAVIMRWSTLPTKIQRELFEHATSLADLRQTPQLKGQIARVLHNHKNDVKTKRNMSRHGMT